MYQRQDQPPSLHAYLHCRTESSFNSWRPQHTGPTSAQSPCRLTLITHWGHVQAMERKPKFPSDLCFRTYIGILSSNVLTAKRKYYMVIIFCRFILSSCPAVLRLLTFMRLRNLHKPYFLHCSMLLFECNLMLQLMQDFKSQNPKLIIQSWCTVVGPNQRFLGHWSLPSESAWEGNYQDVTWVQPPFSLCLLAFLLPLSNLRSAYAHPFQPEEPP